jgi:hypothetical protein
MTVEAVAGQGISKAGNRRVRSMLIEISWIWLRYQPGSKLSLWFNKRFANGVKRISFVNISSGPDVIYVNNIIALIVPKNYPKLSGPYSMISGPFPNHVRYIGLLYRVLFKLFQDFFDLIFGFLGRRLRYFTA